MSRFIDPHVAWTSRTDVTAVAHFNDGSLTDLSDSWLPLIGLGAATVLEGADPKAPDQLDVGTITLSDLDDGDVVLVEVATGVTRSLTITEMAAMLSAGVGVMLATAITLLKETDRSPQDDPDDPDDPALPSTGDSFDLPAADPWS